jgi:hypothetical protein
MLKVQRRQCATCIYRQDSTLNIEHLEEQVRDPRMEGHFRGYRICHHSKDACCAGFWARHKDHFDAGQLARRLNLVQKVDEDNVTY